MPSTANLTDAVFSTSNYARYTDGSFFRGNPQHYGDYGWIKDEPLVKALLGELECHCRNYLVKSQAGRDVNYEDLFFAANQLYQHLAEEYENPALEPFAEKLVRALPNIGGRGRLVEIAELACNYIGDVVAIELGGQKVPLRHLGCLVDAMRDRDFKGCDIFTLNHDLLIEAVLQQKGLPYIDGFGNPDGDVAWWKPGVFNRSSRHYLLKLHGSIDWVWFCGRLAKWARSGVRVPRTARGKTLGVPDRARVLIGTFNKIRDYFGQPYFELFSTFRRQMARIRWLITSGYSFGDKGINWILSEWMGSNTQRKLLVLHKKGEGCLKGARGAIQNLWGSHRGNRMMIHPSHLDQCDWRALRKQYQIGCSSAGRF